MTQREYREIEAFMNRYMTESVHNRDHIFRVLYAALMIAQDEQPLDMDVLIAACMLHDIGREAQSKDLNLDHAEIGAEIAYKYLLGALWEEARARHVRDCIKTHRFRRDSSPASLEAKILFDADKLDAAGLMGIARTLGYGAIYSEPIYIFNEDGSLRTEGSNAEISSFIQEFNYKLRNIYDRFYTKRAAEIAAARKKSALEFYDKLVSEIVDIHKQGEAILQLTIVNC